MLRKEIRSVLKYTGLWLLMVLAAGLLSLSGLFSRQGWSRVGAFLQVSMQFLILFYPFLLGYSMFSEEKKQKSMEYLLTLPSSRRKLFYYKLIPRLSALLAVYALFIILYHSALNLNLDSIVPYEWLFFFLPLVLFILSVPFSLWQESLLIAFVLTMLSLAVYACLAISPLALTPHILRALHIESISLGGFLWRSVYHYPEDAWRSPVFVASLLTPLVLYLTAFLLAMKDMDLRPRKSALMFIKRLGILPAAGVVACTASIILLYQPSPSRLYLAADTNVLEFKTDIMFIRSHEKKRFIPPGKRFELWPVGEGQGYVYFLGYVDHRDQILGYQIDHRVWRKLYSPPQGFHIAWPYLVCPGEIDFLIYSMDLVKKKRRYQLVSLNINEMKTKSFDIPHSDRQQLFLMGKDVVLGRKFWIIWERGDPNNRLFRLWDNGESEIIAGSFSTTRYIQGYLYKIGKEALEIMDMKQQPAKLIRSIPGRFGAIYRLPEPCPAESLKHILIWGSDYKNIYCLDLADWKLSPSAHEMEFPSGFSFSLPISSPNGVLFPIEHRANGPTELTLFKFKDCRFVPFKEIGPIDVSDYTGEWWASPHGIIYRRKGRIRAVLFPDFKEISF